MSESKFDKYNKKVQPYTIRINKEDESKDEIRAFLDAKRQSKQLSEYLLRLVAEDMERNKPNA